MSGLYSTNRIRNCAACAWKLVLFASLACGGGVAQTEPEDAATPAIRVGPSIVLVTIDTLRADRLAPEGPMRRLRGLAARGASFRQTHTQVPLTLPAHTTILTGRGLLGHGVRDNIGYALSDGIPTVAERLSAAGYATAAFVGGYPLVRSFGLARGFDTYDDRMTRAPTRARAGHTERRAEEVVDAALDWLRGRPGEPFFVWVHLFDPHDPYEAPPPFRGRHAHPYDDEVAYADHHLGRLIDGVARVSGADFWTFVTADHGEALGLHGEATHGILLYESTLHVPLVIVPPGTIEGREVATPVSLIYLAPTLLDAARLPLREGCDGRSLLPLLRNGAAALPSRPLYLESLHGRRKYGWAPLSGLLDWPVKYISAPRPEMYDVAQDPREARNVAPDVDRTPLEQRLRETRRSATDARRPTPGPDLERLISLGYVGSLTSPDSDDVFDDVSRPDPKDRIAALAPLDRGLAALSAGQHQQARREIMDAMRLDPGNLVALNNLGILALRDGDLQRASELFTRGLARESHSEHLANNLGIARSRQGRPTAAADAFRRALAIRPGFTAARFNLALALYRQGQREAALAELDRVRAEQPEFPELEATIEEIRAAGD